MIWWLLFERMNGRIYPVLFVDGLGGLLPFVLTTEITILLLIFLAAIISILLFFHARYNFLKIKPKIENSFDKSRFGGHRENESSSIHKNSVSNAGSQTEIQSSKKDQSIDVEGLVEQNSENKDLEIRKLKAVIYRLKQEYHGLKMRFESDALDKKKEIHLLNTEIDSLKQEAKHVKIQYENILLNKNKETQSLKTKIDRLKQESQHLKNQYQDVLLEREQEICSLETEHNRIKRLHSKLNNRIKDAPPEVKNFLMDKNENLYKSEQLRDRIRLMKKEWMKPKATHAVWVFNPFFLTLEKTINAEDAYHYAGRPYYSVDQIITIIEQMMNSLKNNRYLWDALEWLHQRY